MTRLIDWDRELRIVRRSLRDLPQRKTTVNIEELREGWQQFQDGLVVFDGRRKGEPFTPYSYQSQAFDSFFAEQKTALQWSRQTGKTVTTAAFVVYLAKMVPGITALVASFRHEQSTLLLDGVYGWSRSHLDDGYAENLPRRRASTHIFFKNGSKLFSVPHGEASMGRTVDLLIFDESQSIPDDDLRASSPTQAASGGRRIWIGTSEAPEGFWYEITQAPAKHGFNLIRVPFHDALLPNGPLIPEAVEADRVLLSPAQFKMNYELIAVAGINRLFERESALACKVVEALKVIPHDAYWVAGHDHAITRDESVLIIGVVVHGVFYMQGLWSFPRGMPLNRQAGIAVGVLPEGCVLMVDSTGEAGVQCLSEYAALGVNVKPYDYGKSDAKPHLVTQLWQWVQQGKVKVYDQATVDQMLQFRYHLSSSGNEIYGDSSHADDRLNALALCVEGAALMEKSPYKPGSMPYTRVID